MTDYLWGLVHRKNVVHKKMKTYLVRPKILIFENSLDESLLDDRNLTFDKIIRNEVGDIVDKIM